MPLSLMTLKVLLPFQIFTSKSDVSRIVAETCEGAFGLLPHRLDCALALSPGLFTYETEAEGEAYIAIDKGVLVKTGHEVLVSVRQALLGTNLENLRDRVEHVFAAEDEHEQTMRSATAKLEAGFLHRLVGFHRE